jgi:N-acetylglucosamine kinase-like BadF-type ATPase
MGVDGGGSTIRVIVTGRDLNVIGGSQAGGGVNPNIIGHDQAARAVIDHMLAAVASAGLEREQIAAVGIGIAGAEVGHSEAWLRSIVTAALPDAKAALSSDHEIALVGAHGQRRGVLTLSGTGSIAYGVNSRGESALVSGWGYLLGDEGSGYWIGAEALRAVARAHDGRGPATTLADAILADREFNSRGEIIHWLYSDRRNLEIAGLALFVLDHAAAGDPVSRRIVERAAYELALMTRTVLFRLGMEPLPVAFAGSLLTSPNLLSDLVCERLVLDAIPAVQHPPVVGAAILALNISGGEADAD